MAGHIVKRDILEAPELSSEHLAQLTSQFVAVPSVNGEHPEGDLARVVAQELDAAGFETSLVGSDDRLSLGARSGEEPSVLLNGHLDTVPVEDREEWRFDPFEGVIADGAVHGRGACDMKGGLAIQVAVAQWLASVGRADGLVLHFAMGEERGEPGTEDLLEAGFVAPIGVVLEPTEMRLGIAQRGMFTLRLTIEGRAGHASRPELTDNPLDRLGPILKVLRHLEANPKHSHEVLGTPRWTPTMINAGVIPSMVPGSCTLFVDRRMVPGETFEGVEEELRSAISDASIEGVEIDVALSEGLYEPAEIPADGRVVTDFMEAMALHGERVDLFGTPYSSDIRHLINGAGVEAVTYGPGRAQDMHARDEHIQIDELVRAARVLASFALACGDSD